MPTDSKPAGRKPDFNHSAMNMDTRRKCKIGAAWKNDDGSFSISLDPFCVVAGDGLTPSKIQLMLFPNDGDEGYKRRMAEAAKFGLFPVLSPGGDARTLRAALSSAFGEARAAAA